MIQAEVSETQLWQQLDSVFKRESFENILHITKNLVSSQIDKEHLCRSARLVAELHFKNKADPEKRLARGYGLLIALSYIGMGKTALAISIVHWLKTCPGSEKEVRYLEDLVSSLKPKKPEVAPITSAAITSAPKLANEEEINALAEEAEKAFAPSGEKSEKADSQKEIELFSQVLTPEETRALIQKVAIRKLQPGEILFKEGDQATGFYIVAEGQLEFSNSAKTKVVFGEHDFFGEIGLLTELPRTGTVRAKTEAQLLEFSKNLLVETFIQFPKLEDTIVQFLHWRLFLNIASRNPLLLKLDEEQLRDFYMHFEAKFVRAKEVVIHEGGESSALLLLASGELSIVKDRQEIAAAVPGDFVGEVGLLQRRPRSASVVAKTACRVLICEDHMFEALCTRYPQAKEYLLQISKSKIPVKHSSIAT